MMPVVLVVGNIHRIIYKENEEMKEMEIENNVDGVKKLAKWLKDNKVNTIIIVGNYQWVKSFVIALKTICSQIDVKYYPSPKKEKGQRENLKQRAITLLNNLEKGEEVILKEYILKSQEPETYILSREYVKTANQVRRLKHKIYSLIRDTAPELLEKAKKAFFYDEDLADISDEIEDLKENKKMLAYYRYIYNRSHFVNTLDELRLLYGELSYYLNKKKAVLKLILKHIDKKHPLIKAVREAKGKKDKEDKGQIRRIKRKIPDSVYVLLGFIGNRPWTYKRLKTYIGLDTREKNGRRVLDRRRPEVRQYFFIVAQTTALGQEAWEWFTEKHKDNPKYQAKFKKYRGTMMIEAFLQYICRELKIWK
jgi:hypothetical protein